MKKVIILTIVVALFSVMFVGCYEGGITAIRGEGEIVTQTLELRDFDEVELAGSFDVVVSYGDGYEVVVEGHQNIIDRLETRNINGNLQFKLRRGSYRDFHLVVYITVPDINAVELSGSGEIYINAFDGLDKLDLEINGSGDIISDEYVNVDEINFNICGSGDIDFLTNATDASIDVSGSGNIKIAGTSVTQEIDINGSGDIFGFDFITDETNIHISGSGNCEVYVNNILNITIAGSGDVFYKGQPQIDLNISGSGTVHNGN